MSEKIPESIPTSANSSRRPAKRPRLNDTPASLQASSLTALFASPPSEPSSSALTKPSHDKFTSPEIINNVQGSSAGAGSGEFHVYKASRRREYERMRAMDEEVKGEEEKERWEREARERRERDEEATRRKREKRRKKGGKDGKGQKKEGMKARVDKVESVGGGVQENERGEVVKVVEEVGLIIHDDD